ncbi:MAG: class I SAM-dependent methyltransferase [Deltaproteobacteria bacterium]|nr:class I SAM-dependent methyltransferase [Deltaproteobacteria bacterium]
MDGLLLPHDLLVKTGPVDFADWNSRWVLGWIIRQRYSLALSLFPQGPVGRLLEIGYGSGIFIPELTRHAREVFGIDIHDCMNEVQRSLVKGGVSSPASLVQGSAEALPYEDRWFDLVVAISALEFVPDVAAASRECARVLAPGGMMLVVTPSSSQVADVGLRLLTGRDAEGDFEGRRQAVIPALLHHFTSDGTAYWPSGALPLYRALRLRAQGPC